MKKRNKIDVWRESPTKENANDYFAKAIALYNKGDYEVALKGLEKLSEFIDTDLKIIVIPYIEKCKQVLDKKFSSSEKRHLKNQAILKYFGWVDKIKYFTGIASFIFFTLLTGDQEEGITFSDNFSEHPWFLVWAIVLAILTILLHKFMKKFIISDNLIRCKYCGKYTPYINPNEPTYGFMNNNNCSKCGRMYPIPDFYWDGWEGLEYIEHRHSVPDEKFYKEYQELKQKYPREYNLYTSKKKEAEKTKEIDNQVNKK